MVGCDGCKVCVSGSELLHGMHEMYGVTLGGGDCSGSDDARI